MTRIDEIMQMFHGYLDKEWRTKTQCVSWLKNIFKYDINERDLRDVFAKYCEDYILGKHDSYLAHSVRGYYLTSDPEEIKKSIADDESRAWSLLKRVYGVKKRLRDDNQLSLLPEDEKKMEDAYEVIMKMNSSGDFE